MGAFMKLQIEEANHDVAKGLEHQLKGSRFHVAPMSPHQPSAQHPLATFSDLLSDAGCKSVCKPGFPLTVNSSIKYGYFNFHSCKNNP